MTTDLFPPVTSKHNFVGRYMAGEFGNRAPSWNTIKEFKTAKYRGLVHLRNRVAGGPTYYDLRPQAALEKWEWQANPKSWYCSAMAPTLKTLIQGEVQRGTAGIEFYYSTMALPMRQALAVSAQTAYGIKALSLLDISVNAISYEWLMLLLERYPDHVVEFSAYGCCWGTVPGYNAVYWEVRKY